MGEMTKLHEHAKAALRLAATGRAMGQRRESIELEMAWRAIAAEMQFSKQDRHNAPETPDPGRE
jgi:hypothetical protein